MSITGIVILLIIIIFALWGMKRGLVRKISGILSLVISCVLVNVMLPYVSSALKEQTPVYGLIAAQCENLVSAQAGKLLPAEALEAYAAALGVSSEQVSAAGQSRQTLENMLREAGVSAQEFGMQVLSGLSRTEQTSLIRSLPLPDFLRKMMESYNNSEGYRKLQAENFAQYLTRFLADLIMNVLSFAVTMLITWIIVRLLIGSLHLFSGLPVLGAADRFGGLLCGALEGLFVVWLLLTVLSLFSGTPAGLAIQDQIDQSLTLWPVAESNVFLKIITNAISIVNVRNI